jgi:hypothetical protein
MALEHAILVSCWSSPARYELARRFERSIGRFWTATHQQIYRSSRWRPTAVIAERSARTAARQEVVLAAPAGWPRSSSGSAPRQPEAVRHELARQDPRRRVRRRRARGAGRRGERYRASHEATSTATSRRATRLPEPGTLDAQRSLQHVVLRGGIEYERMVLAWLDDVLATLRNLDR